MFARLLEWIDGILFGEPSRLLVKQNRIIRDLLRKNYELTHDLIELESEMRRVTEEVNTAGLVLRREIEAWADYWTKQVEGA